MGKLTNTYKNLTNLAKPPTPQLGIEVGTSSSTPLPSMFDDIFVDINKVKVEDLKEMLDSDGTIQALYSSIVMPLLGSNWTIEPDDPDNEAAVEQAAWVEEALRKPPHKGGMSTPFDLVLAQMLRAVLEGFAGFEKVYEISEGKIVFKKIAWRDPTTLKMRTDERGGFNGLKQYAFINSAYTDITIPLERSFLYTYGKEFHNLVGRSAFLAAYVSYDKKRRLLYLAEQQAQNEAFKIKIVEGREGGNTAELDENVGMVDEVGVRATIGVPNGVKVSTLNDTAGLDLLPFIEFQNAEMGRSVLAMFIFLGTGKTGSYALSTDQSDFFIQALMSIRKSLENHITAYLISDLYQFNFATPEFGTFKFEDITDSTADLLKQVFIKIVEKDRLPEDVLQGVVQKIADKLDIDVDMLEQSIGEPDEPPKPDEQPEDNPDETDPTGSNVENTRRPNLALPDTDGWRRDLTPAEQKVNFDGIEKKLNSLEGETERAIKPIWDALVADALMKVNKYLEAGEYDKITEKNIFDENLKNQYIKVLKEAGLESYLYGKNGASDEIEVKAPATPKDSKDYFADNAKAVVEKQLSDLIFKIQSEVSAARRKDQLSSAATSLAIGDLIVAITAMFTEYYKDTIGTTAITTVAIGVNKGRKDVFDYYSDDIYAYQYSALLDTKTCPTCHALDGKVLSEAEYKRTSYDPPIHFHCRCLWVAILQDEQDPPPITGFPDESKLMEPSL